MTLGLTRCLLLYTMYGEYLEYALAHASYGDYSMLLTLLWGMCSPFTIAIESVE